MKIIKAKNLSKITIDESFILSIQWEEDGNNVVFNLDWCGTEEIYNEFNGKIESVKLLCTFVCNFKMNISFEEKEIGMIFIKEFTCRKEGEKWKIKMTSPSSPKGTIEFSCYEIEMIIN